MGEIRVRIDDGNKVIYGSEPICNRHIYSKIKDIFKEMKYIHIPWMFANKDDILGTDDVSVTIRHSFELNEDWSYKQEM